MCERKINKLQPILLNQFSKNISNIKPQNRKTVQICEHFQQLWNNIKYINNVSKIYAKQIILTGRFITQMPRLEYVNFLTFPFSY